MKLKILFHDNCFDGAASAAIFASFYRAKVKPDAELVFQGVQHKPGDPFSRDAFDGDENVCVDFRYSTSPRLDWWFDHHVSAFATAEERAHFEANPSDRKFYDPTARSNTKFEAGILESRFGFDTSPFRELIEWADIIDGAQFPDARTAVELKEPPLRLMTWIEHNHDKGLSRRFIEEIQRRPLADIAREDWVTRPLAALLAKHERAVETIRQRATMERGVVHFDLIEAGIEAHNKFIAYMLFPDCRYTVGVTFSPARVKISVGSNPWSSQPREHNLARICERYGGGGHPVVGAISLPPSDIERARRIASDIVAELQG